MHTIVEAFGDGNETTAYLADLVAHHLPLDGWSKLPAAARRARRRRRTTRVAGATSVPTSSPSSSSAIARSIEPELRLLPFVKSIEFLTP